MSRPASLGYRMDERGFETDNDLQEAAEAAMLAGRKPESVPCFQHDSYQPGCSDCWHDDEDAMTNEPARERDIVELAEHWEGQCNRYVNGQCSTLRCLVRGGYKINSGPCDNSIATCEEHETATRLRELLPHPKPDSDIAHV